jgi:hypothetical protein
MPRLARDCDGLPESAGWRAQGGESGRPKPMTYITRNQRLGRDSNSHGKHPQSLMGWPWAGRLSVSSSCPYAKRPTGDRCHREAALTLRSDRGTHHQLERGSADSCSEPKLETIPILFP